MHKSRLGNIVIDCPDADLLAAAAFWSQALGYPLPQQPDVASGYIQLITPDNEVQVIIQQVTHEARAHLDIETDDIEAEVERMQQLGAQVMLVKPSWVVMQAPSGQKFCVGKPYRAGFAAGANLW